MRENLQSKHGNIPSLEVKKALGIEAHEDFLMQEIDELSIIYSAYPEPLKDGEMGLLDFYRQELVKSQNRKS